jgi:hypothetical protein
MSAAAGPLLVTQDATFERRIGTSTLLRFLTFLLSVLRLESNESVSSMAFSNFPYHQAGFY